MQSGDALGSAIFVGLILQARVTAMSRVLRAYNSTQLYVAIAALLGSLTFAYAPPAPRPPPPRPVESKPSVHNEPNREDQEQSDYNAGSNRNSRRFKNWSIDRSGGTYFVRDGLNASRYLALLDIVKEHPSWSRIGIPNWRLARKPAGLEEIYRVLNLYRDSLKIRGESLSGRNLLRFFVGRIPMGA